MKNLLFFCLLLPSIALAADESPVQGLAQLPPLPQTASKDLDCSLGETLQKKVNDISTRETTAAQAAAAAPMTMLNDAQMAAMQAMTEPAFNSCPVDSMQEAAGWATTAEEKLAARLTQIQAAKAKEDEAWCQTHTNGVVCEMISPVATKRALADATAAGTQFLKDVQPGYAKYVKQIGGCVAMRDKPVAAARGVKGPFQAMAGGAHAQNWWMVGQAAEAHSRVCMKAREAAQRYLEVPPPS